MHADRAAETAPPDEAHDAHGGAWVDAPTDADAEADAKALASALRLRIIRLVKDTPLTNQQMADALDVPPATLLHHVRLLVDRGFLEAQPVRRGARGSRERPYLSTGKSWRMPPVPGGERILVQTFLDELALPGADVAMMTRLGLRLSAEHRDELERRLKALFTEYADRDDDDGGEPLSIFFAMHADVSRARAEASAHATGARPEQTAPTSHQSAARGG